MTFHNQLELWPQMRYDEITTDAPYTEVPHFVRVWTLKIFAK